MARKKKKSFFKSSKGTITFKILIAVVILGSIAMASGMFPKNQITPMDPDAPTFKPQIIEEGTQKKSIQLKTIDFEGCSEAVGIQMIIDKSDSMDDDPVKLPNLQDSSYDFLQKLTADTPVGLITFSTSVSEPFAIQLYGDIKPDLDNFVKTLRVDGRTNTAGALARAQSSIKTGMSNYPGRQFVIVLVTDGVYNEGGSPLSTATQIKNTGVKIFTIGITQDVANRAQMVRDMTAVSSPNSFFEAPDTTTLDEIYNQIGSQICQPAS
jgi:hypothetical protein